MPKPIPLLGRNIAVGDTCRDLVTGNWAEVKEIDGQRAKIYNQYVNLGWRDLDELYGPIDEYWRRKPEESAEENVED